MFPQEGLQFLEDLTHNNNREWFEAHKDDYVKYLRNPAIELVEKLGTKLQQHIHEDIRYDASTNGSGSLMRINRDIRFSNDKSPYKNNISMMFWQGSGKKMEHPGFGFQFEAHQGAGIGGIFSFNKPMLEIYRNAVLDDKLGAELSDILQAIGSDYPLGGEQYKRVPNGFDKDHPRADLLRYGGLWASSPQITVEQMTSSELVDICFEHCRHVAPLQQWLVKVLN